MISRLIILMIILSMPKTVVAEAQWPLACSENETSAEVTSCLESRLNELAEVDEIFEKSIQNQYIEVLDIIQSEIHGPEKSVIGIPSQEFYDFSVYYRWRHRSTSACYDVPAIPTRDGHTLVGGELSEEKYLFGTNRKAFETGFGKGTRLGSENGGSTPAFYREWPCATRQAECGKKSHNTHCTYRSRNRGCLVNDEWYEWFTRRAEQLSIPINSTTVCNQDQ